MHAAVALYSPRLSLYHSLVNHTHELERYKSISLSINLIASSLIPSNDIGLSLWTLFSFGAFVYTVAILSWPNNPLERCLLRYEGKRPRDQPAVLYNSMVTSYKAILQKLAYGEYRTKRHFFRVAWIPFGLKRVAYAIVRVLSQIPVLNVCFATFLYDVQLFGKNPSQDREAGLEDVVDRTEATSRSCIRVCSARHVCNR